jgi:dihydropyrimidinase
MNEFVAVTSTNIAKILNVYPKKGAILVGADADIVVWDPKRSKTISAKSQQSSIDYNVFEGKEVTGLPRYTLTRGVVAIEESTVKTREGHGQFVKREPFAAVSKALSTWKDITAPRMVARGGFRACGFCRAPAASSLPSSPPRLRELRARPTSSTANTATRKAAAMPRRGNPRAPTFSSCSTERA